MGCSNGVGVKSWLQGLFAGVLVLLPCQLPAVTWEIKVCKTGRPHDQCKECPGLDQQPVKPSGTCDYYSDTSSSIWFCGENGTMVFERVFSNAKCMGPGRSMRHVQSGSCNAVDAKSEAYYKYTCVSGTTWSWTAAPSTLLATTTAVLATPETHHQSSGTHEKTKRVVKIDLPAEPVLAQTSTSHPALATTLNKTTSSPEALHTVRQEKVDAAHELPAAATGAPGEAHHNVARRIWLPVSLAAAGVSAAAAAAGGITAAVLHKKRERHSIVASTTLQPASPVAFRAEAYSDEPALDDTHRPWKWWYSLLLAVLMVCFLLCVVMALLSLTRSGRALLKRQNSSRKIQCELVKGDPEVETASANLEAARRLEPALPPLMPQLVPVVDSVPVARSSPAASSMPAGVSALRPDIRFQAPVAFVVSGGLGRASVASHTYSWSTIPGANL